jgi:hypothetical protein
MKSKQCSALIVIITLLVFAFSADAKTARVTINPETKITDINPLFFGSNLLFWIDDDAELKSAQFLDRIKDLDIRLLRFPGGTAAENYLWNEKRLYNTKLFPFETGPDKTDTDEFVHFCRSVGAASLMIVNTEYSYLEGSVEKGARLAADWVRYCKDKGYNVKYWAIGNEAYWKPYYTAQQYSKLFLRYAEEMKKVDPSIQVGAIGTIHMNDKGLADELTGEGQRAVIELYKQQDSRESRKYSLRQDKMMLKKEHRKKSGDAWWPVVLATAGKQIDFVDVHSYTRNFPQAFLGTRDTVRQISALRQLIARLVPERRIPIALTEWNIAAEAESSEARACCIEQGLYIGEMIGQYINAGIDMANYWPLTMRQGNWAQKALLDTKPGAHQPGAFYTFRLFSRYAKGTSIASASDYEGLYVFAAMDGDGTIRIFCMARPTLHSTGNIEVSLEIHNRVPKSCTGTLVSAQSKSIPGIQTTPWDVTCREGKISAILPTYGAGMIEVKR